MKIAAGASIAVVGDAKVAEASLAGPQAVFVV